MLKLKFIEYYFSYFFGSLQAHDEANLESYERRQGGHNHVRNLYSYLSPEHISDLKNDITSRVMILWGSKMEGTSTLLPDNS